MIEAYAFLAAFAVQVYSSCQCCIRPGSRAYARAKGGGTISGLGPQISRALSQPIPCAEHGHCRARPGPAGLAVQPHAEPGLGCRSGDTPVRRLCHGTNTAVRSRFHERSLVQKEGAQALATGGQADSQSAAPWTFRYRPAIHRFPCRRGLCPVRRLHDLYPSSPGCWIFRLQPLAYRPRWFSA